VIGEDGSTYSWSVGGEPFSDGPVTDIPILPGENTVTLTVENEAGSAEQTITVLGVVDTDGDGLDDEWEESYGFDPMVPNVLEEDLDEDGLPLGLEYQNQTDPTEPDSDGDGYSDGLELIGAGDPLDPLTIAGPVHGFDDAAFSTEPDVPVESSGGVPPWLWAVLAVVLVAPLGYWLGRRPRTPESEDGS
jgi:PKD repeat protein